MSRIRANQITNKGANGAPNFPNGLTVTGIVTASVSASTIGTLAVTGNATIDGNLGVGGTITYEDVARVDATGISTFREGFKVGPLSGIGLTAYKDGSIRSSGVITATTYYGSGANLTGIDATQIQTGNTSVQTVDTGSDGHVKVTTEGIERFCVKNDGNVGINTVTPVGASGKTLDISGGSGQARLAFHNDTTGYAAGDGSQIFADGNTLGLQARESTGLITFETAGAEKLRITSGGQILMGGTTAYNVFENGSTAPRLQVRGTDLNGSCQAWIRATGDAGAPKLFLANTRSTAQGGQTLVQNGDELGQLTFAGSDGSQFVNGCEIRGAVDGAPGADDMPGRLTFHTTADGASSATERMRIDSAGYITYPQNSKPGYSASRSSNTSNGMNPYIFNVVAYNYGSHYNSSDGKFTVPVTGLYFCWFFGMTESSHTLDVNFVIDGGDYHYLCPYASGAGQHTHVSGQAMVPLTKNQVVWWRTHQTAYGTGNGRHHNAGVQFFG